jgi:hypothetical protein
MAENGSRGSGGRKKFVSQKPGQAVFKAILLEDIRLEVVPCVSTIRQLPVKIENLLE